jgi:hypothetical protein
MVRLITDTGLEGVGWASEGTTREEAEEILNKPLDELISVELGATNRPFEMALWDLLGKHTHLPVYKLLAQAFGADGKESFFFFSLSLLLSSLPSFLFFCLVSVFGPKQCGGLRHVVVF